MKLLPSKAGLNGLAPTLRRSLLALLAGAVVVLSPVHADAPPSEPLVPPASEKPIAPVVAPITGDTAAAAVDAIQQHADESAAPSTLDIFGKAAALKPSSSAQPARPSPRREVNSLTYPSDPTVVVQEPDQGAIAGFIPPERTVQVAISRRDLNRIHCPVDVADVFYSKEKPVEVNVVGPDVYVKAQRKMVDGVFDHSEKPEAVDVHIVCADSVYTLLLKPIDIDAVTLRLGDPLKSKIASIAKEWGALPTEEKVQRLTRMVYRDELPVSFTKTAMTSDRRSPRMYRNLIVQGVNRISAPGLGLAALEYEVLANEPVRLDERDFIDIGLSKTIVGITLDPLVLDRQHRKARLIIIERSLSDGR